jgi:hypothetical protein
MSTTTIDRATVMLRLTTCIETFGTLAAVIGEFPEDVWREAAHGAVGECMGAGLMSANLDYAVDMMQEVKAAVEAAWPVDD